MGPIQEGYLRRIFSDKEDFALFLIDPHGDAVGDLVRAIPQSPAEKGHDTLPSTFHPISRNQKTDL